MEAYTESKNTSCNLGTAIASHSHHTHPESKPNNSDSDSNTVPTLKQRPRTTRQDHLTNSQGPTDSGKRLGPKLVTTRGRTGNVADVVLKLDGDVLHHTIDTERMNTAIPVLELLLGNNMEARHKFRRYLHILSEVHDNYRTKQGRYM
ncbi:hypothetical protein HAX54_052495 [Datura stramonium]|uniref:Uncharacterized protein n=1 Tax=Datura stramonium TaxID=4076 RepID=A0ABS8SZ28_DATST|nr:hypothetical protein [Datura stramonium]